MRSTLPSIIAVAAFLALGLSSGCGRGVDLDVSRTFQEAQETFDDAQEPEDFLRAAGLYQSILDRGVVSGVVLYNQGNAYMQAGQRGRAIAAYRQAQRYRPRDPYLEANLLYALGSETPVAGRRPVIEYLLFWQNWLSYPEKFRLAAAAAAVAFALGVLAIVRRRRLFTLWAVGGLVLTLLLAFSAGYDWRRFDGIVHGTIVREEVIVRKGNADSYEPAFTEPLTEGAEFLRVEDRGDWLLIRLSGNEEGWVREDDVVLY
jgi:tetratricopeptide (TPR) repeat protein